MCIRDRQVAVARGRAADVNGLVAGLDMGGVHVGIRVDRDCLLYTSDAADDLLCVDLGGRRNIKKKIK